MDDITLENKKPHILRAIEYAKTKGVTAIKIELEASLRRRYSGRDYDCEECTEGTVECGNCDGEGEYECYECNGTGTIEPLVGDSVDCAYCDGTGDRECIDCEGSGRCTCNYCDGDWSANREAWSDNHCLSHILNRVGLEGYTITGSQKYLYQPEVSDWLQFAKFYNDGSVDSEMTFTVRLDNPDNVFKALEVVEAFTSLADEIGNGIDTNGAGMHMAWLFTEGYNYPVSCSPHSSRQLSNFRRAMAEMMPALYFLAAPSNGKNWTRGFNYRMPNVGIEGNKYSAIFYSGGAMEFRVFDTCYDTPEQLLDNVVVMSNCLKYLTSRYTGPNSGADNYAFGHDNSRTLDRLFLQENTLERLYQHVDKLKPSYYTMRTLRKQRGLTVTKGSIKRKQAEVSKFARLAWQEYEERWKMSMKYRLKESKYNLMRTYVNALPLSDLQGLTEEKIAEAIDGQLKSREQYINSTKVPEEDFIKDREQRQLREYTPEYYVSLSA